MDGTDDISFTRLDIDSLQKLSAFARKNLSQEQWGLLAVIFVAGAASQEVDVLASTDVDRLLAQLPSTDVNRLLTQLREAYMPGKPGAPTRYCIVPVKPPGNDPYRNE
jgi:hypothetical protein